MTKFGAACDHLIYARLITADGREVEASETSHPDLFWAIRGGGGNFGIATAHFQTPVFVRELDAAADAPPNTLRDRHHG